MNFDNNQTSLHLNHSTKCLKDKIKEGITKKWNILKIKEDKFK